MASNTPNGSMPGSSYARSLYTTASTIICEPFRRLAIIRAAAGFSIAVFGSRIVAQPYCRIHRQYCAPTSKSVPFHDDLVVTLVFESRIVPTADVSSASKAFKTQGIPYPLFKIVPLDERIRVGYVGYPHVIARRRNPTQALRLVDNIIDCIALTGRSGPSSIFETRPTTRHDPSQYPARRMH